MNESDKQITVDETPAEETPATRETSGGGKSRAPGTALPLWIALLALGVSIGLAATAYFTWHQLQQLLAEQAGIEVGVSDRIRPLSNAIDGVKQALREDRSETDSRIAAVDARISRLDDDQQSVGHRLNVLASLMGRSERGWTLAEVEYLLRIANQRLQLQRDVETASEALKSADDRLRDLADPHYLNVREQIASELSAVSAVPVVDVEGLSARLGSALESVDELPVAGTRYKPQVDGGAEEFQADKPAKNLDELATLVWEALSELFRLREHDKPVGPMLPPDREYFLRENLRLQLAAARLALLRNDREQYRAALETSADWLAAYFDNEDKGVASLRAGLDSMAAVDITPAVPDVSGSLRLLRQQIQLSEQKAVLPVVPERAPEDKPVPAGDDADSAEAPS